MENEPQPACVTSEVIGTFETVSNAGFTSSWVRTQVSASFAGGAFISTILSALNTVRVTLFGDFAIKEETVDCGCTNGGIECLASGTKRIALDTSIAT